MFGGRRLLGCRGCVFRKGFVFGWVLVLLHLAGKTGRCGLFFSNPIYAESKSNSETIKQRVTHASWNIRDLSHLRNTASERTEGNTRRCFFATYDGYFYNGSMHLRNPTRDFHNAQYFSEPACRRVHRLKQSPLTAAFRSTRTQILLSLPLKPPPYFSPSRIYTISCLEYSPI